MKRRKPLARRRAERELFFWTAREALWLVLLAAVVIALIVSLSTGRIEKPSDLLTIGAFMAAHAPNRG